MYDSLSTVYLPLSTQQFASLSKGRYLTWMYISRPSWCADGVTSVAETPLESVCSGRFVQMLGESVAYYYFFTSALELAAISGFKVKRSMLLYHGPLWSKLTYSEQHMK